MRFLHWVWLPTLDDFRTHATSELRLTGTI